MIPTTRRWVYALIVAYICTVAMGIVAVQWANRIDQESNHQWCELIVPLDTAYQSAVPATELGRKVAAAVARLRDSFDC
jgi:hypothetical protein